MKKKKLLALILALVLILAITTPAMAVPGKDGGYVPADETYGAVATAEITKLAGKQNGVTITIEVDGEFFADAYILIDNNSAGEFEVGGFLVYVSTYGNEKVDMCFITYAECVVHAWEDYIVDPTCVDEGYTMGLCQKCGIFSEEQWDATGPLGHDFVGTNEALVYNDDLGKWVYTCQRCGFDETDNFAAVSGVANGSFLAPWEGPGARPVYDSAAWINYLPASPISGDAVQNSRLYYPIGDDVPDELPLLVFFHGYETGGSTVANINKFNYLGMNLARNGYLVVLAAHQSGTSAAGGGFNGYMRVGANIINQTVAYLSGDNATGIGLALDVDGQPLYGIMGYSMGGILSMNLASAWENGRTYEADRITMLIIPVSSSEQTQDPIPKPGFVYALELSSGGASNNYMQSGNVGAGGYRGRFWAEMDEDIYVVMSTGSGLNANDRNHALSCWNAINHIPASHKQFIGWNADSKTGANSTARFTADHAWPTATTMHALHYAWIRTVSALASTAFYDSGYEYWYYEDFMPMGVWWDGTPIKPASISHANDLTNNGFWL